MSPPRSVRRGVAAETRATQPAAGTAPLQAAGDAGQTLDGLYWLDRRPTPYSRGASSAAPGAGIATPRGRATTTCIRTEAAPPRSRGATLRRILAPALAPLAMLGGLACLIGAARAYPCLHRNPSADQTFLVPGTDIVGAIHGWLSNCYDVTYQCSTNSFQVCNLVNGLTSCTTTTVPVFCTDTYTDRTPSQYVMAFAELVRACGGVTTQAGTTLGLQRIAGNAEHGHWVRVATNMWNTTAGLDPVVACLHRI